MTNIPHLEPASSDLSSAIDQPENPYTQYDNLFTAKELAEKNLRGYNNNDDTVIVLQSLLQYLPRDGQQNICNDILGCKTNEELRQLRDHFVTALLMPIKAKGGKTPVVTLSPRDGAVEEVNDIASFLEPSTKNEQAKLKASCLRRDGNRCVITRLYDRNEAKKLSNAERASVQKVRTECAHIIPFSFASFEDGQDALYRCFPGIQSQTKLSAESINDPSNALTLASSFHKSFGSFEFALEPKQNEQGVYLLQKYEDLDAPDELFLPTDGVVRLTSHDDTVPLPDPILLGVHAAIAKVLHASGLGEVIDEIMEEWDNISCLASDGSTDIEALLLLRSERSFTPFQDSQSQSQSQEQRPSDSERSVAVGICT